MSKLSGKRFSYHLHRGREWRPDPVILTVPTAPDTHILISCFNISDYNQVVAKYLLACGVTIEHTGVDRDGDIFYIYHTRPTRDLDPVSWYDSVYGTTRYRFTSTDYVVVGAILGFILLISPLFFIGFKSAH